MEEQAAKPLRHGYTTGSCAAATAKAALTALIEQEPQIEATIRLPIGEVVTFTMTACSVGEETASAETVKDGGDDPDATHGARIITEVKWLPEPGIVIDGGIGVGRVTKPGLPVPVGEAAINPVPRKMIREAVEDVLNVYGSDRGVQVVVSVPDGEEIAKKTLNGRLGIIGGISILGTRGTVVPFSTSAYKASVAQAVRVAVRCGCEHIVLSTGGRSEKFGIDLYPELPEEAFVEMGDFVGFALKQCRNQGVKRITLVGMMGKFSKLAQGVMMVHSKSAPVDFGFLAELAEAAGADEELLGEVLTANTASQVGDRMQELGMAAFFEEMSGRCCREGLKEMGLDPVEQGAEKASEAAGTGRLNQPPDQEPAVAIETILISMKAQLLGRAVLYGKGKEE